MSTSWTDRIKQIEVTPPDNGWDKINTSLDDTFIGHEFPAKLYNVEVLPPVDTWNKIQDSFTSEESPVIPLKKASVRPLFIRYAVAACLIGLISFAAIKLFSGNKATESEVAVKPASAPQNNLPADSNKNPGINPSVAQSEIEKDNQALEESKHTYARLDVTDHSLAAKINSRIYSSPAQLSTSLPAGSGLVDNAQIQYSYRAAVTDSPDDKDPNRYLMFKDKEGRFIKISKKLSPLFCCVSGEEHDENCNDQLKKWREKIASSPFVPSPDNFMDILDLVSSLQDSRN